VSTSLPIPHFDHTDLTVTTPHANFGSASKSRTLNRLLVDPYSHAPWRRTAYDMLPAIAHDIGARHVVDFGCRGGRELVAAVDASSLQAVGIDFHQLVTYARKQFPERVWIGCHLTDYEDLETVYRRLCRTDPQLFVAAGVLERLEDPRPLLRTIRRLLGLNRGNLLLIAALDRDTTHGLDFRDLPPDDAHFREWSRDELVQFLESSGFLVEHLRSAAENPDSDGSRPSLLAVRFDAAGYDAFLAHHQLPPSTLEHLTFTTEHPALDHSSGIRAYVEEMEALTSPERVGFCFVGEDPSGRGDQLVPRRRWLLPSTFFPEWRPDREPASAMALQLAEQAIYLYPNLMLVEYQDYLGIGVRVAQGKRAGLFPPSVITKARCHGSTVYEEYATRTWLGMTDLAIAHQEKVSIELADLISVSSEFLRRLYIEYGYELDPQRCQVERYPFLFPPAAPEIEHDSVDTLIFFGRRSWVKGYSTFLQAVARLLRESDGTGIKTVVLLGPPVDTTKAEDDALAEIAAKVKVVEHCLTRGDARQLLRSLAGRAICVLPYQMANAPYTLLEAIGAGCPIVATAVGGLSERIPEPHRSSMLCEPEAGSLAERLANVMAVPATARRVWTRQLFEAFASDQARINEGRASPKLTMMERGTDQPTLGMTVIVPCYKTKSEYLEDMIFGLGQQSRMPDEVIFVDDGSGSGYADQVRTLAEHKLPVPFQVIVRETNGGSAAARNTGLALTCSDVIVNLDSDDIPKNDFLRKYEEYFLRNPAVSAVSTYVDRFDDGCDWMDSSNMQRRNDPIGESAIIGQFHNPLGHASSAFCAQTLKDLDGWDDADHAPPEDRALFVKMLFAGKRIGIIPQAMLIYRRRRGSNTWNAKGNSFLGERKIARSAVVLHPFDRFRLLGALQHAYALERMYARLTKTHAKLLALDLQRRGEQMQLREKHDRLRESYRQLREKHERLRGSYKQLREEHKRMQRETQRPGH
jgi:glycosyltransferase involved in cell wall biosynthesis